MIQGQHSLIDSGYSLSFSKVKLYLIWILFGFFWQYLKSK